MRVRRKDGWVLPIPVIYEVLDMTDDYYLVSDGGKTLYGVSVLPKDRWEPIPDEQWEDITEQCEALEYVQVGGIASCTFRIKLKGSPEGSYRLVKKHYRVLEDGQDKMEWAFQVERKV